MTEQEYINVKNLTLLRAIMPLLSQLHFDYHLDSGKVEEAIILLSKLESMLEEQV